MTRLALLIPTLERLGGAERQVLLLANGFAERGYPVSIIALSGESAGVENYSAERIEFFSLKMRKGIVDPQGWIRLQQWLSKTDPVLLHAHLPHAAWVARWSRLLCPGAAVIDTIHTSSTGTAGRRIGYRLSRRLPDRVTAVSGCAATAYVNAGMVLADRIIEIPNGIDTGLWKPDRANRHSLRVRLGLGNEFVWFAAGRLEVVKDYPTMFRALADLENPAHLVIAGSGPAEPALRRLCSELGLEARVRFLGFGSDVRGWMQAADGFILSSRWEGLPICLIEAGACGLPAVATDVAGTREVVQHGTTGFLAKAGDRSSLCAAMARLMSMSKEERCTLGSNARKHVLAQYDLPFILDRWETLYNAVLAERGLPLLRASKSFAANRPSDCFGSEPVGV